MSSAEMRAQVLEAHERQRKRYGQLHIGWNSELSGSLLRRFARLDADTASMLHQTIEALGLSMRAYDRILKLARTIADLDGLEEIRSAHVAEAIQYRNLDRPQVEMFV
ncbi:hypothetical protein [Paenibacillus azoreducens]|uniref:Mg chelatase-related protein C-terminal domain-containing protein n=1 Tax=Paenibacillus azoreducens TaxID=116718 RepID=A0A919YB95_9BACL|nr:hypothetical protein J34TS1_27970 [Paenibacillus azoreducens]